MHNQTDMTNTEVRRSQAPANNTSEFFNQWALWLFTNQSDLFNFQENPATTEKPEDNNAEEIKEYLLEQLGPKQANFTLSVALTLIYSVLFLVGFIGNFLTILIILFNSYMRVPPNFFLLSLGIADMITLTGVMPVEVILMWQQYPWPFGQFGCSFTTAISELVTHVTILKIVIFTVERYIATCHPLRPSLQAGPKRTLLLIATSWILCLIPACSWMQYYKIQTLPYKGELIEDSAACVIDMQATASLPTYLTISSTIIIFIFPLVFLPILFRKIIIALSESQNLANGMAGGNLNQQSPVNHRTVVRMQVAVMVCFVTFRTPLHIEKAIFVITTVTQKWDENMLYYFRILKLIAGISFYLNATVNPFLYSLLSKRFRRGFQDLKKAVFCQKPTLSSIVVAGGGGNKNAVGGGDRGAPDQGCSSSKIQIPLRELKKTSSENMGVRNTTIPLCSASSKVMSNAGNRFLSEPQRANDLSAY